MDSIRNWIKDFFRDPIGCAFDTGIKILTIATGIAILLIFLDLARGCVGL